MEKEVIPQCTLKTSPTKIEHCIEFAKNVFEELFGLYIKNIILILENSDQFYNILYGTNERGELYHMIEIYRNLLNLLKNPSKYSIIKYALYIFTYYFEYIINKLLKEHSFTNIPFTKKPSSLNLNLSDDNILLFFKSFYYILSDIINFKEKYDFETVKKVISLEKINIKE
jgi:hypothetical protein